MRGIIRKRYKNRWVAIVDIGKVTDSETGKVTRKRKWVSCESRAKAQDALTDLLSKLKDDTYVDASKLTLGEHIKQWFEVAKKAGNLRPSTIERYQHILDRRLLKASIASKPIQKVRSLHVEQYYADHAKLAPATLGLDHAILHSSLAIAVRDGLINKNPAADIRRQRGNRDKSIDAQRHAWTAKEASAFLVAAKKAGIQAGAFYALALDTGMRKSELGGLKWANVNLEKATVTVSEQLTKMGRIPEWGQTKTGKTRTIAIASETVSLLRAHKKAQAELKMRNRASYADFGLVFAKEWTEVRKRGEMIGHPLQLNNIGQREYANLITAAGVRPIKFHGLRHTSATLLLQARTPVHVVSERLGHSKVLMTLEVYAHVLPDQQTEAAATLGALLHG